MSGRQPPTARRVIVQPRLGWRCFFNGRRGPGLGLFVAAELFVKYGGHLVAPGCIRMRYLQGLLEGWFGACVARGCVFDVILFSSKLVWEVSIAICRNVSSGKSCRLDLA